MQRLWQDLRFAVRMLANKPGFTLIAFATLALGIGANTAIFSVVNGVLLRPLPYKDPEQLVSIWEVQANQDHSHFSPAEFLDYEAQNQSFSAMAAYRLMNFTLTGAGEPEQLGGLVVTANFFSLLGVEPERGRIFQPEDGLAGAPRVAIISHSYWENRFSGDSNLIGKTLELSGDPVVVVGVMPPDFQDNSFQVWLNPHQIVPDWQLHSNVDLLSLRKTGYLRVLGRLKPNVTLPQAQADLNTIAARLQQQYPRPTGHGAGLSSLHEEVVGNVRPALFILFGAVGLVLLIACANVTSLMLARSAARYKEIAIRMAVGASRWQIVRQLLLENLLLTLMGGAGGGLLAVWGVHLFVASKPSDLPRLAAIGVDYKVLVFTFVVSLLTGLIFGLVPALAASNPDLISAFKDGSPNSTARGGRLRLRQTLVVAEIALAFIVLIDAGLLVNSFNRLLAVKPGFDPTHLSTMRIALTDQRYDKGTDKARFVRELNARLEAIPGVQDAGFSDDLPISQTDSTTRITIDGRPSSPSDDQTPVGLHVINARYFDAIGTRLIKGRTFTERDDKDAPSVFVINQTMARRFWPNEDPVGKRIRYNSKDPFGEIVGVVEDVKYDGLHSADRAHLYEPYQQNAWPFITITLRSQLDQSTLIAAAQREVRSLDPNLPISNVRTMSEVMAESLARRRLVLTLFTIFASLALLLAAIGIYGVLSSSVKQRTRELGIRIALGATTRGVLQLVIGDGVKLVMLGIVIGMAGAIATGRLLAGLLFGVNATDPMTFTVIALLLAAVSVLACYIPARRATKVDPLTALRYE
jgi:putative ABC transport system permease protein